MAGSHSGEGTVCHEHAEAERFDRIAFNREAQKEIYDEMKDPSREERSHGRAKRTQRISQYFHNHASDDVGAFLRRARELLDEID